jgi:hypothetical protein
MSVDASCSSGSRGGSFWSPGPRQAPGRAARWILQSLEPPRAASRTALRDNNTEDEIRRYEDSGIAADGAVDILDMILVRNLLSEW